MVCDISGALDRSGHAERSRGIHHGPARPRSRVLRRQPPPPSQAIEFAFTYTKTHLLPLLLRIWPLPDDLPHAAGSGDLARVRRWFDAEGKPALGDVANHAPATSVHPREPQWGGVGVQQVLDTALA